MADLNAVLQALVLADQQAKANSPYAPVSQFTEQMNPTILQAAGSGQYKPGESMAAGLINGLIGGFSQNLTNSYADKQNNLAYQAMSNAMTGKGGKPEGIHPSVFAPIQAAGGVFKLGRGFEQEDEDRRLQQQVRSNLALKGVRVNEDDSYEAIPGAVDAFNAIEGISPMIQNAIYKTRMGEQLSPEEQQAVASAPMGVQRQISNYEYQQGVQGRFNENFDFKKSERALPGYQNITGAQPSTTVLNTLRTKIQGTEEIKNLLRNLKQSGDTDGFFNIIGESAQMQEAIQGALFNANRLRTNSGANFTATEQAMVKSSMPKTLAGDPLGALRAAMLGRDQSEFADIMMKFVDADKDIALFSQGYKANNRPLTFYPQDLVQQFGLGDLDSGTSPIEEATQGSAASTSAGQQQQAAQYSEQDLISAGYSAEDIQALKAQGAIR